MSLINNQQKMSDIVFAKRNKNYGAYVIRSAYGSTIFKSLFIVIVTVALSIGSAYLLRENKIEEHLTGQISEIDSLRVIPFEILPEKKQEIQTARSENKPMANNQSQNNQHSTLIKDNALDTAKHVVNTDIISTNTSTSTGNGTGTSTNSIGNGTLAIGTGTATYDPIGVDENPEFEGGHAALLAFVRKHLVYPSMAVEFSKQGTLYVKFVVDEEGKVSNILLQNNLGYGLDDEAMRVVKLIPKFKSPGKVKGQPVKTYYQLPIKFKLG